MSNVRSGDFMEIFETAVGSKGNIALPNIEEVVDPQEALDLINRASLRAGDNVYQFKIQDFDPPRGHQKMETCWYPKFFLNGAGMGGQFDGSGVFICSPSGRDYHARVFKFHMCDHEWDESGANHSRGWHPKRCRKCGFDASIDSGD